MKEKRPFEGIVLVLTVLILLAMCGWFTVERLKPVVPWQVELEREDPAASGSSGAVDWPDSLLEGEVIHLNTASQYDLERLPGIGKTRAQAIVDYRQEHGAFSSADDLLQVDGIGPETLEELSDYITVE